MFPEQRKDKNLNNPDYTQNLLICKRSFYIYCLKVPGNAKNWFNTLLQSKDAELS